MMKYVLATKYSDGDPRDHWAVGYLADTIELVSGKRHIVVDGDGKPFRANGFRRVMEITEDEGAYILTHKNKIAFHDASLWKWLRHYRSGVKYDNAQTGREG